MPSSLPSSHTPDPPHHYGARLAHAASLGSVQGFVEGLEAWKGDPRRRLGDVKKLLLKLCLADHPTTADPAVSACMLDHLITALRTQGARIPLQDHVFDAVHAGNVQALQVLCRHGATLQDPGENKTPLLHKAIEEGHLDMLRHLIDNGMDIEVRDARGCTPLFVAAARPLRARHQALLISRGADRHAVDNEGRTLLHVALRSGHYAQQKVEHRLATIKRLLEWGVDPLRQARHGLSALDMSETSDPQVRAALESHALGTLAPARRSARRGIRRL